MSDIHSICVCAIICCFIICIAWVVTKQMQSTITVTLKGEDSTFKKEFNCYDVFSMDYQDKTLMGMIHEAKKEWKGEPEEVVINVRAYW